MKHNVYHDGRVQSLGVNTSSGYATVGVILPGGYDFDAEHEEHVSITSGEVQVQLPGSAWRRCRTGETYVVPAGCTFRVVAGAEVSYLCRYHPR